MASTTTSPVWYVYGVVPASLSPARRAGRAGRRRRACSSVGRRRAAALVSVLDGDRYAPTALETTSGDVEWLSPRAVAHDRVLTWASDHGAVVPLPMFSLFSGADAVRAMLRDRSPSWRRRSSVSRAGANTRCACTASTRAARRDRRRSVRASPRSPSAAAAASPGQRYLLERKLDTEKKAEMRAVTQQIVDEIVERARAARRRARSVADPALADADAAARGVLVLNAAFFVAPDAFGRFQRTLTALVERHGAQRVALRFHRAVAAVSFRRRGEPWRMTTTRSTPSSSCSAIC